MQPFIAVVIPTLNEAGYLAQCIESLMRDPYPRDRLEVLIVDGGSTDRTLAIPRDTVSDTHAKQSKTSASCRVQFGNDPGVQCRLTPALRRPCGCPRLQALLNNDAVNLAWKADIRDVRVVASSEG